MTEYYPSIFWKSKYKTSKEKGYQGTDFNTSFSSKRAARAEAKRRINEYKSMNPSSKHLKFSAHVATSKSSSKKLSWF